MLPIVIIIKIYMKGWIPYLLDDVEFIPPSSWVCFLFLFKFSNLFALKNHQE